MTRRTTSLYGGPMSFEFFTDVLQYSVDGFFAQLPQKKPSLKHLRFSKIIAHRGHHDNTQVFENTLAAFDSCLKSRIWGIELDVRWTEDLFPVVLHDQDCGRVFGRPSLKPSRYTLRMLRQHAPMIPTLQEVVDLFGLQIHLMIELKESLSDPDNIKVQRLLDILRALRPGIDYHLMSFSTEILKRVDFLPPDCMLGIADWDLGEMSKECLNRNYGGLTGHYLFMTPSLIELHHQHQQKIGVGFIKSPNSLYREINRKVDWIFTNHPLQLKKWMLELP